MVPNLFRCSIPETLHYGGTFTHCRGVPWSNLTPDNQEAFDITGKVENVTVTGWGVDLRYIIYLDAKFKTKKTKKQIHGTVNTHKYTSYQLHSSYHGSFG